MGHLSKLLEASRRRKRRLILRMAALELDEIVLSRADKALRVLNGEPKRNYESRKVNPNTISFDEWITNTPNYRVKKYLRMDVQCFKRLVEKIGSSKLLQSLKTHCRRKDCQYVPPETKLAICLIVLGGKTQSEAANCQLGQLIQLRNRI